MIEVFFLDNKDFSAFQQKKCELFLSLDEKERLKKIKNPKTKVNFLLGRTLARVKLSNILNCQPQEIVFTKNKNGRLEIDSPKSNLSFNISHSNEIVILAISKYQIGIDVEFLKQRNFLEIADYFFTKNEKKLIQNANSSKIQKELFYQYWTLKEAFIKCNGAGIFDKTLKMNFKKYQSATFKINEDYLGSIFVKVDKTRFQLPENIKITRIIFKDL